MDRQTATAVGLLGDPTRAALFEWVQAADGPVTREAAAAAVGISRKLAAFHLDRLVEGGLLSAAPGATHRVGRAPKVYRPSGQDVRISIPAREHGTLAEVLLAAIAAEASGAAPSAAAAAPAVAAERGREIGAAELADRRPGRLGPERGLQVTAQVLARHGYQPASESGAVRLRNCPFHPLADQHRELVCALNQALIAGVLDGLQARSLAARLVPDPNGCCVRIETVPPSGGR